MVTTSSNNAAIREQQLVARARSDYESMLGKDLLVWRIGPDARHLGMHTLILLDYPVWVQVVETSPNRLTYYGVDSYRHAAWDVIIKSQWPCATTHWPQPWIDAHVYWSDGSLVPRTWRPLAWEVPALGLALPALHQKYPRLLWPGHGQP